MNYPKIVTTLISASLLTGSIAQNQSRAVDKNYSKKIIEQDTLFDKKEKKIGYKEVSIEIPITKLVDIFLDNSNRSIEIKIWDEPKVKIITAAFFDGTVNNLSSEAWFEKLNISTKLLVNSLRIKSGTFSNLNTNSLSYQETIEVYTVDGKQIKKEATKNKVVTIYIPKENKLSIESKYADVSITNYLKKLNVDITNGSLELGNINSLTLRSKYANVTINEVQNGEIDFINGKLSIQNLGDVELDTKYSTVEIGSAKKLNFKSTNDEYELEDVAILEGSKNYGNLRISKLTESIQLDGTNADIKIKNISSQTKSIWIDNKYADLRIPLKNLRDFNLTYDGTYSTIYKNFIAMVDKYHNNENKNIDFGEVEDSRITTGDAMNSKFKATVGAGKDAKIAIKCQNCTVDFR